MTTIMTQKMSFRIWK